MSFSRMKPLPKALALGAVVAILIGGGNFALGLMPKKPVEVAAPAVEVTTVPSEASAPPVAQTAPVAVAPAPAAGEQPSGLVPASGQDAGLNAVINAGKK
jgi:hypothetical protein